MLKVMTEKAPVLPGLNCEGENEQEEWLGNPEQERDTRFPKAPPKK